MLINRRRSFITGVKSTFLSANEKYFLKKYKPWGIILFSRNIKSISQTKKLTDEIRQIFKDKKYPILIDQEGGRINRFKNFFYTKSLTSKYFGELFKKDRKKFDSYYKIFVMKTSLLLKAAGINIVPFPVDFQKGLSKLTFMSFIPSANSLKDTSFFFREMIGRTYYYFKY